MQAPPEIAGPIFEQLKYIDESNPLKELYLSLLTRAIDKERQSKAHPAFVRIIEQMSGDEAEILMHIARHPDHSMAFTGMVGSETPPFAITWKNCWWVKKHPIQMNRLAFPDRMHLYINHLLSLNLLREPVRDNDSAIKNEFGEQLVGFYVTVNYFGLIFLSACVPDTPTEAS